MSKVSYFQRYSQKENHVTNNTLLVMQYFYQKSPQKLESVLSNLVGNLVDEELEIGPNFNQQVNLTSSVLDASISQKQFDLFFETKIKGELRKNQIKNHINSIKDHPSSPKILFGLTKEKTSESERKEFYEMAEKESITFIAITFADIFHALKKCCAEYETELKAILDDYKDFLIQADLIPEEITVFQSKHTMEVNLKYKIFSVEKREAPTKQNKYIGLFKDNHIKHIALLKSVIIGSFDGEFKAENLQVEKVELGNNPPTNEDKNLIYDYLKARWSPEFNPEEVGERKFYLFDKPEETSIERTREGVLRQFQYLSVPKLLKWNNKENTEYSNIEQLAELLKGTEY